MSGFNNDTTNACQIIHLSDHTKECVDMPDYPISMHQATGAIVSGTLIICGGRTSTADYLTSCYTFDASYFSWIFLTNLTIPRSQMASVSLDGALWITGGYTDNGGNEDATTEIVFLNGTVSAGPMLPSARDDHCMVNLHDGKVLILGSDGGSTDQRSSIIFDITNNNHAAAPRLLFDREGAGCTIFKSAKHNNRHVILVVGGENTNTAEIYDYTESIEWEESK